METIQGMMACTLSHPDLGSRVGPWHSTLSSYALYTTKPGGSSFQNDRNICDFFFLKHLGYVINLGFVEMLFKRL